MGYYIGFIGLAIASALQITVLPLFRIDLGQMQLVMLLVLAWSVHANWTETLFWAVTGSMMQDLLSITPLGTSLPALLITVFLIKSISKNLYRFNIILLFAFVIMMTIIHQIILVIILPLVGFNIDLAFAFQHYTIPTLVWNVGSILPIYGILRLIQMRLPRPQSAWETRQSR